MKIKYIALLRGINVGGNNKVEMSKLKLTFEKSGFTNVRTHINSGNIIFESELDETNVKQFCENLIFANFNLRISIAIITTNELRDAINHSPEWWGKSEDSKHNAIFVMPPFTAAEVCKEVGEVKPEYEKVAYYGKIIFWSAPIATFHHTRWSKVIDNKKIYQAITIRNANTTLKLLDLANKAWAE